MNSQSWERMARSVAPEPPEDPRDDEFTFITKPLALLTPAELAALNADLAEIARRRREAETEARLQHLL
ncbi:hypothetical protein [Cellulomonas endometrii]|uniref:hypothetical protein n=1 Tax=Cellulomonas endometrii TaxID=3036301 RepID=UPI0024ACA4A1|nr:hypothetical protein [Cellulomonas endometrii]